MTQSTPTLRPRYDAVIVGARCAGAATAMLLARQGLRVLAVDRQPRGSDTLSTHALMRGAVLQLHRWGVLPAVIAAGTPPVRTTTFAYGAREVQVAIRAEGGVDALYAPRRTVLDRILVEAAEAAGAELLFGRTVTGFARGRFGRVTGVTLAGGPEGPREIAAGLVIGADGLRSTIAGAVGAETWAGGRNATAVLFAHVPGRTDAGYRWHFAPGATAGAIPTNGGEHCVFVSVNAARRAAAFAGGAEAALRRLLAEVAPPLAAELAAVPGPLAVRVFGGVRGFLRTPAGPGWALVGDAGHFRDPVTAHGITDALRDAELVARAAVAGTRAAFEDYRNLRDALALPILRITDRIAGCDWSLEEVAALHVELNAAMRTETTVLGRLVPPGPAPRQRAA